MNITLSKSALKFLRKCPKNIRIILEEKIETLANKPRTLANNIKKIKGSPDLYRLRVGDYRILYNENGDILNIIKIGTRSNIYD